MSRRQQCLYLWDGQWHQRERLLGSRRLAELKGPSVELTADMIADKGEGVFEDFLTHLLGETSPSDLASLR